MYVLTNEIWAFGTKEILALLCIRLSWKMHQCGRTRTKSPSMLMMRRHPVATRNFWPRLREKRRWHYSTTKSHYWLWWDVTCLPLVGSSQILSSGILSYSSPLIRPCFLGWFSGQCGLALLSSLRIQDLLHTPEARELFENIVASAHVEELSPTTFPQPSLLEGLCK